METWIQFVTANIILVSLILVGCFGLLARLSVLVWNQHKEIESSELKQLGIKIDDLSNQISFLFRQHDLFVGKLENLTTRVSRLEKRQGEHFTRCNEREKVLTELSDNQKAAFKKYDRVILANSCVTQSSKPAEQKH